MTAPPSVDLRGDFAGYVNLTLPEPTPEGRQEFTLYAGQIDHDAESFFGRGFCHWLAGAVHSITGWDLYTIDYCLIGEQSWRPAHSGVLTPAGTVLDIFGEHNRQDVCDRYLHDRADTRPRVVEGPNMPGDVITGIDDLRGDPSWWANKFHTPELQGMVLHFARLLLDRHGYGDHIRDTARPAATQAVAPQPKCTPNQKETTMSFEELGVQFAALAQQTPHGPVAQAKQTLETAMAEASQALEQIKTQGAAIIGPNTSGTWVGTVNETIAKVAELAAAVAKVDEVSGALSALNQTITSVADRIKQGPAI